MERKDFPEDWAKPTRAQAQKVTAAMIEVHRFLEREYRRQAEIMLRIARSVRSS